MNAHNIYVRTRAEFVSLLLQPSTDIRRVILEPLELTAEEFIQFYTSHSLINLDIRSTVPLEEKEKYAVMQKTRENFQKQINEGLQNIHGLESLSIDNFLNMVDISARNFFLKPHRPISDSLVILELAFTFPRYAQLGSYIFLKIGKFLHDGSHLKQLSLINRSGNQSLNCFPMVLFSGNSDDTMRNATLEQIEFISDSVECSFRSFFGYVLRKKSGQLSPSGIQVHHARAPKSDSGNDTASWSNMLMVPTIQIIGVYGVRSFYITDAGENLEPFVIQVAGILSINIDFNG